MTDDFPIPGRLNLAISALQLVTLLGLLAAAGNVDSPWALAGLAIGYALVMNSTYAMLHEAEHGLLHPNRAVNETTGALLALFFPAPFHLLRQGHIGHHLRNRSDDEAFDFYFDGESRLWKTLQLYGILTGFFYLAVVLGNLIALARPRWLKARWADFDRPTRALLDSLNPRYFRLIRIVNNGGIEKGSRFDGVFHGKVGANQRFLNGAQIIFIHFNLFKYGRKFGEMFLKDARNISVTPGIAPQ